MKRLSYAQLESKLATAEKENSVAQTALNALANDEFALVGKSHHYTVKIARVNESHGGIVLVRFSPPGQKPYASAYYLEDWFSYWQAYIPAHTNDEWIAIRNLAFEAHTLAVASQRLTA